MFPTKRLSSHSRIVFPVRVLTIKITRGRAKKILGCSAQSIRHFIKGELLEERKTEAGRCVVSENSVHKLVNQKKT